MRWALSVGVVLVALSCQGQPPSAPVVVSIHRLRHASCEELAHVCHEVLGVPMAGTSGAAGPCVAFDERTNSVICSGSAEEVAEIVEQLQRIDVPLEALNRDR